MQKHVQLHLSSMKTRQQVFNSLFRKEKPIPAKIVRIIKQRAEGLSLPESFGLHDDSGQIGFESLLPTLMKAEIPEIPPRVMVGSPQCKQPYSASILNVSALSFGPMGKPFILALNRAASRGGFYQNTGEAGISPYHFNVDIDVESTDFDMDTFIQQLPGMYRKELEQAGDVVWQIGNGYFGCRKIDGSFDPVAFQKKASLPNVKMIELKLSQGVEPCRKMPVKQVTSGIAKIMGINWGKQAVLQDKHSEFSSPVELLQFAKKLRELSDGKPVGVKLGISHRHYFLSICKAMLKTKILLDFITVDGMEAGTAAASYGSFGFTGTSLKDAVLFVHNALVGTNLRSAIKIVASGRVFTEKEIISILAHGADLCATARGFLLSVGCDQQGQCYNGSCSKGIATQNPDLLKLFPTEKNTTRLHQYHYHTIRELMNLLSIIGVQHTSDVKPSHLQKRIDYYQIWTLDELYHFIKPGSLLTPCPWRIPKEFKKPWHKASATTF